MDLNTLVDIGTLVSLVVAAGGLFFGIRVYRRQMNAQLFLEYTSRYELIMSSFPAEARSARLDLSGHPPEQSEDLTTAVLRYLNLCSEEFYLWKRKYLARDIWNIWESELQKTLQSKLLLREWESLRREFESYPEFVEYVERAQAGRGA